MRLIAILLAFLTFPAFAAAYETHTFVLPDGTKIPYVLVLPANFDPAMKYETLLAFPGGDQTIENAESTVERFWEPNAPARGVIVVVPAAPTIGRPYYMGEGSIKLVPDIVAAMRAAYPVKDGPIHVAGHSNGGVSAFRAAIRWPDLFQSLTVIAGFPAEQVDYARLDQLKGMRISLFVGSNDFDWKDAMRETDDALTRMGIAATFTVVPASGHELEGLSFEKSGPVFDTVVPAPQASSLPTPSDAGATLPAQ